MILIVGLGNFPPKYDKTRHNFGFMAVDFLVKKFGFSAWKEEKKFFSLVATGEILGEKAVVIKPQTFMNVSGKAVLAVKQFYKIPTDRVWVFSDDLDLSFGETRFREKGSAGGQKGLADIVRVMGTSHFSRVKFGISNDKRGVIPTENFVLSKFTKEELEVLPALLEEGVSKFLAHIK